MRVVLYPRFLQHLGDAVPHRQHVGARVGGAVVPAGLIGVGGGRGVGLGPVSVHDEDLGPRVSQGDRAFLRQKGGHIDGIIGLIFEIHRPAGSAAAAVLCLHRRGRGGGELRKNLGRNALLGQHLRPRQGKGAHRLGGGQIGSRSAGQHGSPETQRRRSRREQKAQDAPALRAPPGSVDRHGQHPLSGTVYAPGGGLMPGENTWGRGAPGHPRWGQRRGLSINIPPFLRRSCPPAGPD